MPKPYKKITSCEREGQYEGIYLEKDGLKILELRITLSAILDESCKLKGIDIHEWLYEVAKSIIDEVKEFRVMQIIAADVIDGEIVGSWKERELNKF